MTEDLVSFIRTAITTMIGVCLEADQTLTRGEIYDAIAQDLERRCQHELERRN